VVEALGAGLEKRPDVKPTDSTTLDRYERLIEATRLAGREQEAFDLFWCWEIFNTLGRCSATTNQPTESWRRSARRADLRTSE
jgi:hypothetical protein